MKNQFRANELFAISRVEGNSKYYFPLSLLSVQDNNKSNWGIKIATQYIHFWIGDPVTPGNLLKNSR